MLTPNQIKNVMFTKSAVGGYKINEVDEFILVVCGDYSKLYKENSELHLSVESLNAKVKEYSENEDNIKTTLVTAQKMADKIVGDAKAERERIKESTTREFGGIVGEAKVKAKNMVEDATKQANDIISEAKELSDSLLEDTNRQVEQQQKVLAELKREVSEFREKVLGMYEQQTAFVKDLPALEKKVKEELASKNKKSNKKNDVKPEPEKEQPEITEAKVSTPILDNINDFLNKNFETMEEISKELEESVEAAQEAADTQAEAVMAELKAEEVKAEKQPEEPVKSNDSVKSGEKQKGNKGVLKVGDDYDIFDGDDD